MLDAGLLRFLELVVRELGALDARVELGGKDPEDPRLVFRPTPAGARVVAVFGAPPEDRAGLEARLDALIGPLFGSVESSVAGAAPSRTPPDIAHRRLDDELAQVAERAGAVGGVVVDITSPVVWGASPVATAAADALIEAAIVRVKEARGELRAGHTSRLRVHAAAEMLARPFAGVYVVALVFAGAPSEPVAMGTLLHAMPLIEKLVLALPPVEPPPRGGKIVRMPVRLR